MLKRILALLTALLLCPILSAQAEDAASPLYLLVHQNEAGEATPAGCGVVYLLPDLLLTTRWALQGPGTLLAVGDSGTLPVEEIAPLGPNSELVLLLLSGETGAKPVSLSSEARQLFCAGYRSSGDPVCMPAGHVTPMLLDGLPSLQFSAEEALLPGSVLLDAAGQLAGLTVARYGEGEGRFAALTGSAIYAELCSYQEAKTAAKPVGLQGFTAVVQDGCLLVDWTACTADLDPDSTLKVFFAAENNPYYSSTSAKVSEGSILLPVVPGLAYSLWLMPEAGEAQADLPQREPPAMTADVPEAKPFELFGYQDTEMYLGILPAGKALAEDEDLPRLEPVTAQALADADSQLLLQVTSTYPALEQQQEALLLFVLTTPEGHAFAYEATYIFDPSLALGDTWRASVSGLFTDYITLNGTGAFAPGEYTLGYYLDGALASQITFTLN